MDSKKGKSGSLNPDKRKFHPIVDYKLSKGLDVSITARQKRRRWIGLCTLLSIAISILAIVLMMVRWNSVVREPPADIEIIKSGAELERFIVDQKNRKIPAAPFAEDEPFPIKIPTGVYIQSLVFSSSSNVNMTGYIWQKYPYDYPYKRGFDFPEQVSSGDTIVRLDYCSGSCEEPNIVNRATDVDIDSGSDDYQLMGWYFDVSVRESFDYTKYPLDYHTIWLRLWPKEIANDHKVLLVPDFDAYLSKAVEEAEIESQFPAPFGLDEGLVQGEWEVDTSFFGYREIPYDTNFGFGRASMDTKTDYREFHFNLGVKRKFLNAFIINLVPLFVVALLLFSAVMTITGDKEQSDRFGFSTSGLLGTCSALFFVVMLSHIQVRSMFPGSGLVYIEYFYLVMYGAILLTALNGYLFSLRRLEGFWLLQLGDNIIPKLTYWPLLLCGMLLITWVSF